MSELLSIVDLLISTPCIGCYLVYVDCILRLKINKEGHYVN